MNVTSLVAAHDAGQVNYISWRKVPSQTTASGIWFDLSMSPGNPVPNYYAATPLSAVALARSTDGGLDHGGNVTPLNKYLSKLLVVSTTGTAAPLPIIVLDYLMYYPFVAQDAGDQTLTTGISLPRYPTGAGVQIMAVEVASQIGSATFYLTYTNQSGVAGRVTQTVTCNTQTVNGTIISSAPATLGCAGPFIPLQMGDTGVRSIQTVTFISGDIGLMALVLVKPLASISVHDTTAPVERDFLIDSGILPKIEDDAYLNMIVHPVGTLASAPIIGELHTVWSN